MFNDNNKYTDLNLFENHFLGSEDFKMDIPIETQHKFF